MAERYEVPCIGFETPIDSWQTDGPYHWAFDLFWPLISTSTTMSMCGSNATFLKHTQQMGHNPKIVKGTLQPEDTPKTAEMVYPRTK